jgi:hypothetical protein
MFSVGLNLEKWWLFIMIRKNTMVTPKRLNNVYDLTEKIITENINGDLVECGVWKGGCVAIMAYVQKKHKSYKKIWMFDSFEGLPEPTEEDGENAKIYAKNKNKGNLRSIKKCVGPLEDVKAIFKKLDLNWSQAVVKRGWFQETLPNANKELKEISLLRLDGDWYESTKICLDQLYTKVSKGGYIIIDDYYHWEGARKAIDEFLQKQKIKAKIIKIDNDGAYFRKT